MKCRVCGSYAINHHLHGRDGSDPDLCDVCYWRKRCDDLLLDAVRYRWIRSAETIPFNIMKMENIGELLDIQVDAAMSGFLK